MVELAIGVAAFLFLCWVAFQGFVLVCTIFAAITESREGKYMLGTGFVILSAWLLVWWFR